MAYMLQGRKGMVREGKIARVPDTTSSRPSQFDQYESEKR